MILTHPWLFNTIVVLFIAFTSGWLVFVFTGRRSLRLRKKIRHLEAEKEKLRRRIQLLDGETRQRPSSVSNAAPVISLTAGNRLNQTNG